MGIFFSSSKKKVAPEAPAQAKVSDKDRATLELKRTRDKLRKNQTATKNVIAREAKLARELIDNGMRQRAITVLKRKKYQVRPLRCIPLQNSTIFFLLEEYNLFILLVTPFQNFTTYNKICGVLFMKIIASLV